MESSEREPALDFLASFAAQRQRILGHAAHVLNEHPDLAAVVDAADAPRPLPSVLLASLEAMKVAEEELRRQFEIVESTRVTLTSERDRFRNLFENAPAALMLTDPVGSIHEVNRAAAALLGRDAYHLERKPMPALVPPEERATFRHALGRIAITRGATDWRFTIQRQRDMPALVRAAVSIVADSRFGSALYWHLEPVQSRAD